MYLPSFQGLERQISCKGKLQAGQLQLQTYFGDQASKAGTSICNIRMWCTANNLPGFEVSRETHCRTSEPVTAIASRTSPCAGLSRTIIREKTGIFSVCLSFSSTSREVAAPKSTVPGKSGDKDQISNDLSKHELLCFNCRTSAAVSKLGYKKAHIIPESCQLLNRMHDIL